MAQGITFTGLGSGLDTNSIITQLISIEKQPITLIQNRQATLGKQKEIIQSINSGLLSLKDASEKMTKDDLFSIVKATSADADRVGVTAANTATAGTFNVEVLALAQARTLSSRSFASVSSELGLQGEFVINGKGIKLSASDTLTNLRDAINQAGAGVTAQILSVSSGDNRLILTAEKVGADGFDLKDASATDVLQSLGFTSSDTKVKNSYISGGRSTRFLSSSQAVGTLLGLSSPPAGTVKIGDQQVAIDLATDSLEGIRDKINAAAPTGVTAQVVSSVQGGLTRYQLEITGTTEVSDANGALEALGVLDGNGNLANQVVGGAQSDLFTSTTTALGSLLGLASAPSGSVTIGGQTIALDLGADSLSAIQAKINAAAPAGVSASLVSSKDADGNSHFRLRLAGATDMVDQGNVLETLGLVVGSNKAFDSVAQMLTSDVANQAKGALRHTLGNGAQSDALASTTDAVGGLIGSTAAGAVTIGDRTVELDLAADSLESIRDKINAAAPTGVVASIDTLGPASFALRVEGTTNFDDASGVLQALGVVEAPTALTADTRFADILGAGVQAGDTISISGTDHDGVAVSGSFAISSTNLKVQDLLSSVEQLFGNKVSASVDSSGRIAVQDKQAGASSLALTLKANNQGGGRLDLGNTTATTEGLDARSAELRAGQDAQFRINGIALSRATNTVTDAVEGVTLNLKEAEAGKLVSIAITKDDTTEVRSSIEAFVTQFNTSMKLINDQFVYDSTTKTSGPLSGDATLMSLQSRLRSVMSGQIDGVDASFNALVMIGISFDKTGVLNIDSAKLDNALANHLDQVRQLFVSRGSTSDSQIEFISSTKNTKAGNYAVSITQAPDRAQTTGTVALAGGLTADQTLMIRDKASGKTAAVDLKAGDSLNQIVSAINTTMASQVAEERRGSIANTTDGSTPISASTTLDQIFGAGVKDGDTIRINGTTHDGTSVSSTFAINQAATKTVGDLLDSIRSTFNSKVSAAVDSQGRIVVTDNEAGDSSLTVTLVEGNEGGGSLDLGSLEVAAEGRAALEIAATNQDGKLALEHNGYGSRNGFEVVQGSAELGLAAGDFSGTDVAGTIDGQAADGFGRILTGKSGSGNADGLSLRVKLTSQDLSASGNERGNVTVVHGVGRLLTDELSFITDSLSGTLTRRLQAIDDTVQDMDDQITTMEQRVEMKRLALVNKFAALEGTLSSMQSQGNFLSAQLSSLATTTSSSGSSLTSSSTK